MTRKPGSPNWSRESEADLVAIGNCGTCVTVGVGLRGGALVAHLDPDDARDMAAQLLASADEADPQEVN